MKFSQKLQLIKKITSETQEQLAKRLDVSFVTFNSWINDKSQPRLAKGKQIDDLYKKLTGQKLIPVSELQAKKKLISKRSKKRKDIIKFIKGHSDIYDELTLLLTYNSNRIEGSTLTVKETAAIIFDGASIPSKDLVEHLEAKNHQTAFDFLMHHIKKNFVIKEEFLLKLHSILMNGIRSDAGRYRNEGVRIVGSRVVTANYLKIPELMKKLIKDINKVSSDAVERAAEIHSKFEQIHPFSDGNGRIGRLIMNAMLIRKNIAPALIKQQERQLYYTYLQKAQLSDDNSLFQDFVCDAVLDGFDLVERS